MNANLIIPKLSEKEAIDWCFERGIYFYGIIDGCNTGFCNIIKVVGSNAERGQKVFAIDGLNTTIENLYNRVYTQNHLNK